MFLVPLVDAALRGGLQAGTLTELVGPNGGGKTQFCMTMCTEVYFAAGGGSHGRSVC